MHGSDWFVSSIEKVSEYEFVVVEFLYNTNELGWPGREWKDSRVRLIERNELQRS